MKIEKLNENKIKIIFDYKELEENNISVHSFLSNSIESQKLFWAILDIANEDLDFDIKNSKISYEVLSFDNKSFVVFVTKSNSISKSIDTTQKNCSTSHFDFYGNKLLKTSQTETSNIILYRFIYIVDVFSFCDFINSKLSNFKINSSLYKYNNMFFIKINIEGLTIKEREYFISIVSEFKNSLKLSDLSIRRLDEYSDVLIKDNAIQNL